MNFIIRNVSDYISKVFTLVSSRNCVMHCNSLEILIRFYDPKNHQIRRNRNKRIFVKMIDYLSTEKQYTPLQVYCFFRSLRTIYKIITHKYSCYDKELNKQYCNLALIESKLSINKKCIVVSHKKSPLHESLFFYGAEEGI